MINHLVNSLRIQKNPDKAKKANIAAPNALVRRRMSVVERERQIFDGVIQFFSVHGLNGQLRDLAKSLGVTHALPYHYFATKQTLIDRVYAEVFEGRWRVEWDALLDSPDISLEEKFTAFYLEYVTITLSQEFVRILVFPRLIKETRRFRCVVSHAKHSEREVELLMGLQGSFFYIAMRRWIYAQHVRIDSAHEGYDEALVRDRVCAYLQASQDLFIKHQGNTSFAQPNTNSTRLNRACVRAPIRFTPRLST